jgi:hypothetical protein
LLLRRDATDQQIDQLVYELYGLTEEEIRVVEEATQWHSRPVIASHAQAGRGDLITGEDCGECEIATSLADSLLATTRRGAMRGVEHAFGR